MRRYTEIRSKLIDELCDVGELVRRGEDLFEDLGGHVLHESNLDTYIDEYMKQLHPAERSELVKRLSGNGDAYLCVPAGTPKTLDEAIARALGAGLLADMQELLYAHVKDFLAQRFGPNYLLAQGEELERLQELYASITVRKKETGIKP